MDLSNAIRSVIPSVHGDVLGVLGRTSRPLTGRGVAELLNGRASAKGVSLVLNALVSEGIVIAEQYPPAILYRLNQEHLAAESIIALATMRERLLDLMREKISAWYPEAYGAWVFGSFARGTATSASDIDVLVVRPDDMLAPRGQWNGQVQDFEQQISACTGNDCRVVEFSVSEFTQLFKEGEQLARELRKDGIALTKRRLPTTRTTKVGA